MLSRLAALRPGDPDVPEGLTAATRYLDLDAAPTTLVAAGEVSGAALGVVALVLGGALAPPSITLAASLLVAVVPAFATRRGPVLLAALRRTRALGEVTGIVGRLVLQLRVDPALERAVEATARSGTGPLATSLASHAARAASTPEAGLGAFATEWRRWDPTVGRACSLVRAAADAPAADRERLLDRALDAARDGTRERLADFVADVRGPTTALYAFGVLLPLALVGVLPAARAAGVAVPLAALVVCYDLVLPAGLIGFGLWLLARRPVAFPPPEVTRRHSDVPDSWFRPVAAGASTGTAAAALAWLAVPWSAPIALAGCGAGCALVVRCRPTRAVRDRVATVERGLPDALSLVGRRVAAGVSVERALVEAADELPGATGELLSDATRRARTLGVDVPAAFLGDYGVLDDVPGRRVREAATLFSMAAREGSPAGDVLLAAGDHLDELRRVETRGRRELAAVTDTLANTAAVFGPLVGGVTVSMAGRLDAADAAASLTGAGGAGAYPTAHLGLAVGGYVLLLAVVLTALSVGLSAGLDRAEIGYRVGVALPVATTTFVTAVVAGDLLL